VTTVPIIEIIDDNNFQIHGSPIESAQVGGFEWNLMFDWHLPPKREMERRKSLVEPIRSVNNFFNRFLFMLNFYF
jgi:hypothetical protein